MVQYVMMRMNSHTSGETMVTWRDVVRGTPWLTEREEFSPAQEAVFRLQPNPAGPNELEREMEAWWQVKVLKKKCEARSQSAATQAIPPDAPLNTPATDIETGVSSDDHPAGACSRPPPGINMSSTNQFVPDSDWTQLPNPRDNPAPSGKYRMPFDELDLELGRSSLVEIPLSCLETEEAVGDLLKICPDLPGGPTQDVEMMELSYDQAPDTTQTLNASPVRFRPEISNTSEYNYNLMDPESGMSTAPGSPVMPEEEELLDMDPSPAPDSPQAVVTSRPRMPRKMFGGREDPEEPQ